MTLDESTDSSKVRAQARVTDARRSALRRYQDLVVGSHSLWYTLKFELIVWLGRVLPGALGLAARKLLYPRLFRSIGSGTVFGADLVIRHPGKIDIGRNVVISDGCALDARGENNEGIRIGDDTILGDGVMVRTKSGYIDIGRRVSVSHHTTLAATQVELRIGDDAMIGPYVFLGGSQYQHDRADVPIHEQGLDLRGGGITIGPGCWLGAMITVPNGVSIGANSIIGAGAVLREDVPPDTMLVPHQKLVAMPRYASDDVATAPQPPPRDKGRCDSRSPVSLEVIHAVIYAALDEVNAQLPAERRLSDRSPHTRLQGDGSPLDSMALVNLIVAAEEQIETRFGRVVNLAGQRQATEGQRPLATVASLAQHIQRLMGDGQGHE